LKSAFAIATMGRWDVREVLMQIRILHKECCGHGQCREIAPGAFGVDSKNKAVILDPESETPEKILEAAETCPCSAIVVMDDEGEIVFP